MAVSVDSHHLKGIREWTPLDVHDFLESILPGHPCADLFTYTSGYVLDSLEKDELRRQAKDEEAANVIWAELKVRRNRTSTASSGQRRAVSGATPSPRTLHPGRGEDGGLLGSAEAITVYVRTRQEAALELEVRTSDSVASLKELIAEREGTPKDCQRLVFGGMSMQDARSLSSYDVPHGASLLLVPQLREQGKAVPRTFAPRGVLMVPGSAAWHPRAAESRPYLPVLCSHTSRSFPVSLEFGSQADVEAFASVAQQGSQTVLEIQSARRNQAPIEVRVHLDPDTGCVRLENSGDILAPSTEYEAVLHFGGRGGHVKVTVCAGALVA